jgi:hypothetical protein
VVERALEERGRVLEPAVAEWRFVLVRVAGAGVYTAVVAVAPAVAVGIAVENPCDYLTISPLMFLRPAIVFICKTGVM